MQKIDYDNFMKIKKDKYFRVPALLERKRLAKSKPRDSEERNSLMMRDYERYKEWIKNKVLIELAPRKYIFK